MRAQWKDSRLVRGADLSANGISAWVRNRYGEWAWEISTRGVTHRDAESTEAAAKLAAERELRRLIGEAVEAMGGTVNWDAATSQEGG